MSIGSGDVPTMTYRRRIEVLWRAAPDRVVITRTDAPTGSGAAELIGPVAFVWLALDEPATQADVESRLAEAGVGALQVAPELQRLLSAGLIEARAPLPAVSAGGR